MRIEDKMRIDIAYKDILRGKMKFDVIYGDV